MRVEFSTEALMKGLRAIWNRSIDVRTDIEKNIFEETLRLFNQATAAGLSESKDPAVITDRFLEELRTNNAVFSAFRTHRMQNDIARQLIDPETGQLKSFDRWRRDIKGMTDHYVDSWLKTEYDTAINRAHQAADWKHFEEEADVFPNVRWMPTTSVTPDPLHQRYWEMKLTLPVNHPFWDEHHPGDRWNCKCTLQQTDEPVNAEALEGWTPPLPMPGLDNNPADDGKIFSDTHPYYTEAYPGAAGAVRATVGKGAHIPSETIQDAEKFAERFVQETMMDRTFKGKVSYKGLSVDVADRINEALVDAFDRLDMPKISGIKAIPAKSATGKKVFSSADAVMAFDPVQKGIYLNSDILGSMDKFNDYVRKSREAFEKVKHNLDKLPPHKRAIAERYIKAGRELVDDSLEGMVFHELGHHVQWDVLPTKLFNELGDREMEKFAAKLSGYAGTSKSEYVAESFVSWMKREKRIDPRLQEFLDGLAQKRAAQHVLPETRGKRTEKVKPQSKKILKGKEGIAAEMEKLHELEGDAYWKQLKTITERKEFKRVEDGIFSAAGKTDHDYENLLSASRKMTRRGYTSYILPNPKGSPSADIIVVRKGVYKMYDVKTITGVNSVSNRLEESKKQTKRVLLQFQVRYDPRKLANEISGYFNSHDKSIEVMAAFGKKSVSILKSGKNDKMWKQFVELFR